MSPITHGMLAWIIAVMLFKNASDRRFIVFAGIIPDIDGVFILFDQSAYNTIHHTFGHSLVFGIMVAIVAGLLSSEKVWVMGASIIAFSVHLFSDLVGSNCAIQPLSPLSDYSIGNPDFLTNAMIYDIINPATFFIAFFIIIGIMYYREISPFEFFSEKLDKWLFEKLIIPAKEFTKS